MIARLAIIVTNKECQKTLMIKNVMLDTIVVLVVQFQILLEIRMELEIFVNQAIIVLQVPQNRHFAQQELMSQEKVQLNAKTAPLDTIVKKVQLSQLNAIMVTAQQNHPLQHCAKMVLMVVKN